MPSIFGTLLSLFSLGILIAYGADKYIVMTSHSDTAYTSKQRAMASSNSLDSEDIYNSETMGLYMAWMVENTTTGEVVPRVNVSQYIYPEVKVITREPNNFDVAEDLTFRECTEADLFELLYQPDG